MYSKNDYRNYLEHRLMESDDFFAHYGIPGMRWHKKKKDAKKLSRYYSKMANYDFNRAVMEEMTGADKEFSKHTNAYDNTAYTDYRNYGKYNKALNKGIRDAAPILGYGLANKARAVAYGTQAGTTRKHDSSGEIMEDITRNALELAQTNSRKRQRGARKKKVSLDGKKIKRRKRA